MNTDSMIIEIWKELAEAHVSGILKRALDIVSNLKMFCTYNSPEGVCGIAFSFDHNIRLDISPFSNLSEIEVSLFKDNSFPNSKFLLIQLVNKDSRAREIFAAICVNIAHTIQIVPSEKEAVKLVVSQMRKWQNMFSKKMVTLLSVQEQQGLFGELSFLKKLIDSPLDKTSVIESWVGPNMAPQDFQGKSWAVEVKTTTVNKFPIVSINGELQLDETYLGNLFLYNLLVDIVPVDGKNLPELINDLRNSLIQNEKASYLLENKLLYYGYFSLDEESYQERRYHIRKENFYLVKGEFPRIKKDDLLLGVSDVKYKISLAVPTENIVEERNVINTILSYEGNQ